MRRLRVAERVLVAAGLALIAFYVAARGYGEVMRRSELARFATARETRRATEAVPAPAPPPVRSLPPVPEPDERLWSPQRIRGYEAARVAGSGQPLAVLRIPGIGLTAPVLDGTEEWKLNRGVGWIEGTARPEEAGNVGVAGHRDGFFRGLKDVKVGDAVELETLDGVEPYLVDDIRIVDPEDVSVLRPTATPAITMVTCYPFYFVGSAPRRYIVRAVKSPSAPASDRPARGSPR